MKFFKTISTYNFRFDGTYKNMELLKDCLKSRSKRRQKGLNESKYIVMAGGKSKSHLEKKYAICWCFSCISATTLSLVARKLRGRKLFYTTHSMKVPRILKKSQQCRLKIQRPNLIKIVQFD